MTLLLEEMLSSYIISSCKRVNVECTPVIFWIYFKYITLMEKTMAGSTDSTSIEYLGEVYIMLSCVVSRMFRCEGEQQLIDLRKSYEMADMELDESDYPYESAMEVQATEVEGDELIQLEKEEMSELVSDGIYERVDDNEDDCTTNNIYHNGCEDFHITQLDGMEDNGKSDESTNVNTSDDRIESNSDFNVSNDPDPPEEPINLFMVKQERDGLKRNTRDFMDIPPDKVMHLLPDSEMCDFYWNYNISLYEQMVTHKYAIDPGAEESLPGFGLSVGEYQLLSSCGHVSSCIWNPSEGAKRFMALMHKPWLPGRPSRKKERREIEKSVRS